ncbi:MAG: NTP transferase domain-containing protein [Duncaniella sp.]|nr:NTP transferase domain-containing protein [Duncaniella sp.]
MKALIFAAGLGTRLGSITQTCPKALVEVGGEPMLKRVILKLKRAGIDDMVVNIHHHADMIRDYLSSNNNFGVNILLSDESNELLDTGGGLLKAKDLLVTDSPVLLHNADILTDFNVSEMIESHRKSEADVTLLVAQRTTSRYLLFDDTLRMKGWTDIGTG